MDSGSLTELIGVLGPTGGVFLYLWMTRDKTPKSDPVKELATQLNALNAQFHGMDNRLIRIETLVERMGEEK